MSGFTSSPVVISVCRGPLREIMTELPVFTIEDYESLSRLEGKKGEKEKTREYGVWGPLEHHIYCFGVLGLEPPFPRLGQVNYLDTRILPPPFVYNWKRRETGRKEPGPLLGLVFSLTVSYYLVPIFS